MKKIVRDVYVVKPYNAGEPSCCIYVVDTKSDDGLVLIDPGLYIESIQDIEKEGFELKNIKHCLITHGHLDHFGACHELSKFNKDIKFYAHELDAEKIEKRPTDQYVEQYFADYNFKPVKLTRKIKVDNEILKFGDNELKCIHIPGHTQGSIAYLLETEKRKILFGGDVPGIALDSRGGNLDDYLKSMQKLSDLNIDILCEGHSDIIKPAKKVTKNINGYMKLNKNLHIVGEVDPTDTKALLDLTIIVCEVGFYENALDFCNYLLEIDPNNTEAHRLLKKIKKHNPPKIEFLKGLIQENFNIKSDENH